MVNEFIRGGNAAGKHKCKNIYVNLLFNVWNKMYICMQILGFEYFRKCDKSSTS